MPSYVELPTRGVPIRAWIEGVPLEEPAKKQLVNVAELPITFHHVAAMPDVHWGIGATVGSVIATKDAIIPAAVGVDIGCGMMAVETTLAASQLPDHLHVGFLVDGVPDDVSEDSRQIDEDDSAGLQATIPVRRPIVRHAVARVNGPEDRSSAGAAARAWPGSGSRPGVPESLDRPRA